MTRRKKPPPQQKRQQVTDSAGWTHVIKGPSGVTVPKRTNARLEREHSSTESKYTLKTYLDRFRNHHVPIWKQSDCFKSLSRIFEQDMIPPDQTNMTITRCVCLGLGSMTAGSESSSYELAALMSMLEILGKTHHPPPNIIFQDPIFTSLDRTILQTLGHTVLDTPKAFSLIDGSTFLFAPHLECQHYATALGVATPVLTVGSDVQVYVHGLLSSVAESSKKGSCQIFRDFMGKVDSRPMPDFDRTSWCESTRIYWVRSQEGDSGEGVIEQGVTSLNLDER